MRLWRSSLRGVLWHAQLGGKIQRLVDRQLHVDDVFLRHVADLVADGIEVLIDIDIVDEHLAVRGGAVTGDGIHQGGFPAAALSHHHDELTRLEDQRDILQQVEILAHPLVEVVGLHPHAFGLIVAGELVLAHHKPIGSDADRILRIEPDVALDTLVVDEGAVGAAHVGHIITLAHTGHLGMEARDVRLVQDDIVRRVTPKGDLFLLAELDRKGDLGSGMQGRLIGHAHHHAGLVAVDAQDIPVGQQLAPQDRAVPGRSGCWWRPG